MRAANKPVGALPGEGVEHCIVTGAHCPPHEGFARPAAGTLCQFLGDAQKTKLYRLSHWMELPSSEIIAKFAGVSKSMVEIGEAVLSRIHESLVQSAQRLEKNIPFWHTASQSVVGRDEQ